ncbi:MAG: PilZ domain-containing protein [Desulfobulbaceae bacterium]|uniref:PilZ domain-containing protein n=1 Tax=Candidatus Desulfatifera sulfidica TaxID=2841691 RepID=A0A8J6N8L2_9BACT|nr:PilZ domain-containing protein [Candidatus Desulfatifera sulfidica]
MPDKEKTGWDQIPSLDLKMDADYTDRIKPNEDRSTHRTDIATLKTVLRDNVSSLPVKVATTAHGIMDGSLLDLSNTGCRASIPQKLNKGERAKVGFKINQRTIVSKAIVKWISPEDDGYSAGLEFQEIADDLKEFLGTLSSAALLNRIGDIK